MSDDMKPILLIGGTGQVGRALSHVLPALGPVVVVDRSRLDLCDSQAVRGLIASTQPRIIINAAAYTAVDRAESEPGLAMAINATAPGVMAEECRRIGALLVHYSTDYVFDGSKPEPYLESDPANPLNVYGRSKLAGERAILDSGAAHFIFRTSWVYAAQGHNFLNTIIRLAAEKPELRIVDDQVGAPTWAGDLARMTVAALAASSGTSNLPGSGIYHMTAAGSVTWFEFARAILDEASIYRGGAMPELLAIKTADYPTPAQRPANSRLDHSRLTAGFGIRPGEWRTSLRLCLRERFQSGRQAVT